MKQAKKRAKKQNQSVQRRKSSLTTNLPGLEMDGVIYTFYEGTDDAKMDWDTAKVDIIKVLSKTKRHTLQFIGAGNAQEAFRCNR